MMSTRRSTTTSATECTLCAAKIDFPSGIIGTTQQHVGGALVFNSEFMLLVEELVTVYPQLNQGSVLDRQFGRAIGQLREQSFTRVAGGEEKDFLTIVMTRNK